MIKIVSAFLVLGLLSVSGKAEANQGTGDLFLVPFMGGYSFDGSQGIQDGPIFGLRLGRELSSRWGVEGGIGTVSTKQESEGKNISATRFDIASLYHFKQVNKWDPFATAGAGTLNVGLRGADFMLHYGIGAQYLLIPKRVSIRAAIRHLLDFNSQHLFNNFEVIIGLTFHAPKIIPPIVVPKPQPPDLDQDQIPDSRDICPNTPLGEKVEERGVRQICG